LRPADHSRRSGVVDYLSWSQRLKLDDIPLLVKHCRVAGPLSRSALTERELQLLHNMIGRLSRLAEVAAQVGCCYSYIEYYSMFLQSLDSGQRSVPGLAAACIRLGSRVAAHSVVLWGAGMIVMSMLSAAC
jgi:hypothetical protein